MTWDWSRQWHWGQFPWSGRGWWPCRSPRPAQTPEIRCSWYESCDDCHNKRQKIHWESQLITCEWIAPSPEHTSSTSTSRNMFSLSVQSCSLISLPTKQYFCLFMIKYFSCLQIVFVQQMKSKIFCSQIQLLENAIPLLQLCRNQKAEILVKLETARLGTERKHHHRQDDFTLAIITRR